LFLLFAPLAMVFYKSFRKPKKGEVIKERRLHNLAKNFMVLWPIYIVVAFVFFFTAMLIKDSIGGPNIDFQYVGEALFWFGGMFACIFVPLFVVFPVLIALVVMLSTKKKK
jgi:hypothetical protein